MKFIQKFFAATLLGVGLALLRGEHIGFAAGFLSAGIFSLLNWVEEMK